MALPENRAIPPEKFPEKVQKFVSPRAPEPMRMMLARGMVPMKPVVQVCALFQLSVTSGDAIARQAVQTIKKLPVATMRQICAEPLLPQVLDWLVDVFGDARDIRRVLLLNKRTDNDTVLRLAGTADEETCELIARNQQRLLDCPSIIETLYLNRNLRASTADRIVDFAARSGLVLDIPLYDEIVAAIRGEGERTQAEIEAADAAFAQAQIDEAREEAVRAEVEAELQARQDAADVAKAEAEGPTRSKKSAAGRIRELNIAQKMRLAMMGTRTERAILITDTNKLVARSVIRSPAVSDGEAMNYAKNRALMDEIIMYIANNRKWTRHYLMKLALVNNPKTPTATALRFLTHLRLNDLRAVARSRNVPPVITKQAKGLLKKKMK